MRRWWSMAAAHAFVLVLLSFCASPAGATGPSPADRTRLAALLREGARAGKAGQWDACIKALSAAAAIEEAPTTAGDLGLCEEQAGQFAAAHRHLLQARLTAPVNAKEKEPYTRYREALARVTEHVAVVFVSTRPSDARVLVDGQPLGVADGTRVALSPGKHTFLARREGYEDKREEHVFKAGSLPHVDLVLTPAPKPPEPLQQPQAQPSAPQGAARGPTPGLAPVAISETAPAWYVPGWSPHGVLVTLAYASGLTAVVSGATAIGLDIDRSALASGLDSDACRPHAASRPHVCGRLAERYEQQNAALGVAIGGLLAGGLFAGAARIAYGFERGVAGPVIAPTVSTSGAGIVIQGTW